MRNKKIIYHWSGRGTIAPLAAALHLGLIIPAPGAGGAAAGEITRNVAEKIPFGQGTGKETGTLVFLGTGKGGEEVYLLARGKDEKLLITLVRETARLLGADPDTYYFVDCEMPIRARLCSKGKREGFFRRIEEMVLAVKEDILQAP